MTPTAPRSRTTRRLAARVGVVAVALAVPLAAAGCSSSGTASTTTTSVATTTTTLSAAELAKVKAFQIALTALGCYTGAIDGLQGSATVQAIRNFQQAAGLTVDGVFGAATDAKALADVKAGLKVCSSSTTTTTKPSTSTTTSTTKPSTSTTTTVPATTTTTSSTLPS